MLKRRIIPVELLEAGRLVKTIGFNNARDVGDPVKSSKVYSDQDADELVIMQIDRTHRNIDTLIKVISKIAEHCFVPLTVGGGVTKIEDARRLLEVGADKILINSAAYRDYDLITQIAKSFGSQAVVVSMDVLFENGDLALFSNCGRMKEAISFRSHVAAVLAAGAGELMLQVINRDGMMQGYDLDLLHLTRSISTAPVIAGSGAGNFMHLKEALEAGADAVACGSLFNFGDNNPLRAKAFLKNYGIPLKKV